eukprot:3357662-Ditylum_brightwellii.AAC.2
MSVPISEDSNDDDNGGDNSICPFQDWTFYYQGWEVENAPNQNGTYPIPPDGDVLFPPSHRGCLDAGILQKLGMSHQKIEEMALYFLSTNSSYV